MGMGHIPRVETRQGAVFEMSKTKSSKFDIRSINPTCCHRRGLPLGVVPYSLGVLIVKIYLLMVDSRV